MPRVSEASEGPRIQYLLIGHITRDLIRRDGENAERCAESIGGTASYSGLTALAYGAGVRVLTSCRMKDDFPPLNGLEIHRLPSPHTTTFENSYDGSQRRQRILAAAGGLDSAAVPAEWRAPDLLHLAPVAGEVDADAFDAAGGGLRCATLQGWMRERGPDGSVRRILGGEAFAAARGADAAVLSTEDLAGDEEAAERIAECCPVTVITDGPAGCRVYWNGHQRRFPAPHADAADPTGAGDIFAAVFFLRLHETRDPYEAARMANVLAARSVTRPGLSGVPTPREILEAKLVINRP